MALTAEQVHNLAVHHRIRLSQYSTTVVHKIVALLNRTEASMVERLARTSNETIAGQRLETLLVELRAIQSDGWRLITARLTGDLQELALAEAAFAARLAGSPPADLAGIFSPLPSQTQIMAAVNARPFQGRFLAGWLEDAGAATAAKVRDTIRQGFVEGRTTDQIIRAIRGTRALKFKDGLMEVSRRGAETMVRTAITHTSNAASQASYQALGVAEWRFVATLDARTSLICAGLHGQVFPVGQGPQPPRHPNCRSTSIPVADPIPGVVPFKFPSYPEWLRSQPASVQDDILGTAKAKLFRAGLTIDRFVDNKGRGLTLDQLRERDSSAFERAGVA